MSYLDLILRFWQLDKQHCFSSEETRLYFYLLDVANDHKPAWPDSFDRADPKTAADNRMAVNTMKKWRNRLEDVGLISVQPGGKGQGSRVRYQLRYQILTPKEPVRCQVSYQNLTPKSDEKPSLVSGKVSEFDTYSLYTRIKTFLYLAIDPDKVSNFDTYVRKKIRETPPPSGAPPFLAAVVVEGSCQEDPGSDVERELIEYRDKLQKDRRLVEGLHKLFKLNREQAEFWIENFVTTQWSTNKLRGRTTGDLITHCQAWIKIQLEIQQKNEQRTNHRQSVSGQSGTQTGAGIDRLAEKYFGA